MRPRILSTFFLVSVSLSFSMTARSESKRDWATLSVDSEPRGAEVYVDSEYQGVTPLQNARVPAGYVPVTLLKEGFVRQTTRITLKAGETKSLGTIQLGSAFGEIFINSYPPRATVYLDGDKIKARTPLTIRKVPRDKPHTIRLQLEGYDEWEREIILEGKDKKKYDVELEKR
ncbi:MAG TPA: PEGA domain-containing protein [bacterium]|nr:PEGA domain-containing protein [bacterium]